MPTRGTFPHLFGREEDLRAVAVMLDSHRVVTLCGPGGVGKTRIAEQVVSQLPEDADVVVVRLDEVPEPDLVGPALAAAVGIQAPGDPRDPAYLVEHLGDRAVTFLIDNCEHLVDVVATLTAALVAGSAQVRVLATSQRPLGIVAESVYLVEPLAVPPGDDVVDLDRPAAAVAMFVDRTRAAVPGFTLTAENAALISAIVRTLEGLPLAIQLAAPRLRTLSLETLSERLDDMSAMLVHGFRDVPDRHRSLEASIRWTERICTPLERELWARLAVFVGGFDLVDAEQVCSGDGIAREEVLQRLGGLVEKSVVQRVEDGRDHYRMLESVREHGARMLAASGGAAAWQQRHLDWFAEVADDLRGSWVGADQVWWIQRLQAADGNLNAALEHALPVAERVTTALQMCHDLTPYWIASGRIAQAGVWGERVLAASGGSPETRSLAAGSAALVAVVQSDLERAREMLAIAQASVPREPGDLIAGLLALVEGQLQMWDQDNERGLASLRSAVEHLQRRPRTFEWTAGLTLAGALLAEHGSVQEGRDLLGQVAAAGDRTGEGALRAHAQSWLAMYAALDGDGATADRLLRSALRLAWELRNPLGLAAQLEAAGLRAYVSGDREQCAVLFGAGAALWRRIDTGISGPLVGGSQRSWFSLRETVPERYPEEFARGLALPLGEAVRLAFEQHDAAAAPRPAPEPVVDDRVLGTLTRRETEVARLVADGSSNREIATRLFISERTAQGHVQNILRKLDFGSRAQVATWVVRQDG